MLMEIKHASANDIAGILQIYAPFIRDTAVSFEYEVPSHAEMERRVATVQGSHAWFVASLGGQVAGYAYASPHRAREAYQWACEVSVYIHPDHHRKGLAQALYTALFNALLRMGFRQALAGIALPNAGSVGLHAAMGFETVAVYPAIGFKFGQWWDTCWMRLPLGESSAPPQALRRPSELGGEEWKAAFDAGLEMLARKG